MSDESFYRLQAYLLHEHDVLLSVQTLEAVAADVNWDDTVSDEVRNLTTDDAPQEIELTPEGRAIAAAYKKRQEEGNGHG